MAVIKFSPTTEYWFKGKYINILGESKKYKSLISSFSTVIKTKLGLRDTISLVPSGNILIWSTVGSLSFINKISWLSLKFPGLSAVGFNSATSYNLYSPDGTLINVNIPSESVSIINPLLLLSIKAPLKYLEWLYFLDLKLWHY